MIMKKNPVTTVSTSVHVMFWNPICPSIGVKNIPMIDPIVVKMNPKITAFGAYGNNTGQSKAGFEFGTSFIEIPWKAGTNSANSKRTPAINTYKPVTNCNACKNMNTM